MILIAPAHVVTAADAAFQALRTMRDRIGEGRRLAEYEPVLSTYGERLHSLRSAIRRDLGVSGETPPIPL